MLRSFWRRRPTRFNALRLADALLDTHGEEAFFVAHTAAWEARGEGARLEARLWRMVAEEITATLRRRAIVRAVFAVAAPAPPTAVPARPSAEVIVFPAPPRAGPYRVLTGLATPIDAVRTG
ncbi:hypothetical protein [Salinarimonas sp.]|uniref:hypothetical protein n=1 Tax=Salinarimonas sp. TaxID=2766526 RepID=UPI0032D95E72